MDQNQTDHLKAYGIVFRVLNSGYKAKWLLNYRGGSFVVPSIAENECYEEGVKFQKISGSDWARISATIENNNMEIMELEKAPKIAVYSPDHTQPWDDAVTLVFEYARIPYDKIWMKRF